MSKWWAAVNVRPPPLSSVDVTVQPACFKSSSSSAPACVAASLSSVAVTVTRPLPLAALLHPHIDVDVAPQ